MTYPPQQGPEGQSPFSGQQPQSPSGGFPQQQPGAQPQGYSQQGFRQPGPSGQQVQPGQFGVTGDYPPGSASRGNRTMLIVIVIVVVLLVAGGVTALVLLNNGNHNNASATASSSDVTSTSATSSKTASGDTAGASSGNPSTGTGSTADSAAQAFAQKMIDALNAKDSAAFMKLVDSATQSAMQQELQKPESPFLPGAQLKYALAGVGPTNNKLSVNFQASGTLAGGQKVSGTGYFPICKQADGQWLICAIN